MSINPKIRALCILLALALNICSRGAQVNVFVMEGESENTSYDKYGVESSLFIRRFEIATDGNRWRLKGWSDNLITEVQAVYDGKHCYTIYSYLEVATQSIMCLDFHMTNLGGIIFTNGKYISTEDNAIIGTYKQPITLPGYDRLPWLSLIVCGVITNSPPNIWPPWVFDQKEAERYKHVVREDNEINPCCNLMEYVLAKGTSKVVGGENAGNTWSEKIKQGEYVVARFRVLSCTNHMGRRIPLESELISYLTPHANINMASNNIRARAKIKVNRIFDASEDITAPAIRRKTHVMDTRISTMQFTNVPALYAITGSQWLKEDDPRLETWARETVTNYLRQQEFIKKMNAHTKTIKGLSVMWLMLLLILIPPFVYFLKNRKSALDSDERKNPNNRIKK